MQLSGQSRAEYIRHLNLIDLQIDLFNKKEGKAKRKDSNSTSQEDSSSLEQALMKPPQSLKEIFQISNNNRKRNKQRKKSKLESC